MCRDMQVRELQCAGKSGDQGHVFLSEFRGKGLVVVRRVDVCWGPRGDAAGERRIIVDVEFEEVEEGVGYQGDGAVEVWANEVSPLKAI